MKNYCSSRREHADRIEDLQAQPTSKLNQINSKKDFRNEKEILTCPKEKEILTCPVERHKSRPKKNSVLNLKLGFKPPSALSAGEIEV